MSAVLLGSTLMGCAGKAGTSGEAQGDPKKETQAQSRGEAESSADSNFNAEGLPILKEKETFTIAVPQRSTLKAAADKACVIAAEEATNIHIEWVEIPQSGWQEKINIMFSTDSLPDAVLGDVDMARNYEQLAPLDDYLESYAPAVTAFLTAGTIIRQAWLRRMVKSTACP